MKAKKKANKVVVTLTKEEARILRALSHSVYVMGDADELTNHCFDVTGEFGHALRSAGIGLKWKYARRFTGMRMMPVWDDKK